jgi:hypothetical protein
VRHLRDARSSNPDGWSTSLTDRFSAAEKQRIESRRRDQEMRTRDHSTEPQDKREERMTMSTT